jgi:DNA invertase Pin-like site-specific DNA recombinase
MFKRKAYSYIRMSTDNQLKGDSLRRQLEASENYAKNNQLELEDTIDGIPLKDIGVSAFKGKNTHKGVLSVFLEALDQGKIEKNSVLLIESLDRLSRDRISEAIPQFINILNNDIEIVTLADNQKYTKEIINQNPGAMFVSLGVMFRANEESEIKSKRLIAAWANKRSNSFSKVLTRNCPAWLNYSDSLKEFEVIKERGEVVKLIIQMCINTCGFYRIAKHLNENKVPVFGKGKIWRISYIKKIVINPATYGLFQPHHYVEGKRVKIGSPVIDYFPKVIDEEKYLLAQSAVERRNVNGKGRKGLSFTNLFAGITYCGLCGFRMMVRDRGGAHKSSKYLLCNNNLVKAGCLMNGWNLNDFQNKIFHHLNELNFKDLLASKNNDQTMSLLDQAQSLEIRIKSIDEAIERAIDTLVSTNLTDQTRSIFQQKISQLENDKQAFQATLIEIQKDLNRQEESQKLFNSSEIKLLISEIENKKDDYLFRSALNQHLTKMIDKIELYEPKTQYMPWEFDEESPEIRAFRLTFKIRQKKTLNEILESLDFIEFQRNFNRSIKIKYKTGAERYLMWGIDTSLTV